MLQQKANFATITFITAEDIKAISQFQIICKKQTEDHITIARPRLLKSYCYEFCGKYEIEFHTIRFLINNEEPNFELDVRTNCIVMVYNAEKGIIRSSNNQLKDSFFSLRKNRKYTDITIHTSKNRSLYAHKCILSTRSEKFCKIFESKPELQELRIEKSDNIRSINFCEIFEQVIDWIYTSEIYLSGDYLEIIDIALLADEYNLVDLRIKTEDHMLTISNENNLLEILVFAYANQKIFSQDFLEMTIHCFVENYDKISLLNYDIEKILFEQSGLITKVFSFINSRKNKFKRVSFLSRDSSIYLPDF